MKKFRLFVTAIAMGLGLSAFAQGDVVEEGYRVDFETAISIPYSGSWKVAPGWGYVLDKSQGYYSPSWTYYNSTSGKGVDGTGCLSVGTKSSYYYKDYLITPALTGKMTIQVYGITSSSMDIKFYAVNEDGTIGDRLTATSDYGLTYQKWSTFTVSGLSNQKVAIDASAVRLDNFYADNAVIVLEKKLSITASLVSSTTPDCDADGNYTVTYKATVKNAGECELDPTVENYNITICQSTTKEVVATMPITQTLAVGESSDPITITATLNYSQWPDRTRWDVYENISNTFAYGTFVTPTPYKPILNVANSDGSQTSPITKDFGSINVDKTQTYTIANTGAAPMNITEIAAPDAGYSVAVTKNGAALVAPFTIAAHETATMTITALAAEIGTYNKSVIIKGEGVDDFTINVKSVVLDANKYYVDFEDGKIPAGFLYNSSVWTTAYYNYDINKYCAKSTKQLGGNYNYMLCTPLLEVAGEDDEMTFEVAKQSSYSNSNLNVYYSADRENWTPIDSIKAEEFSTETVSSGTYKFTQFSIKGIPAGNYYIGFESGYAYLDNIYGFKKVDVDHDITITNTTVPATGMVNNAYTVSVDVKNINDKNDAAIAELYVDGVLAAQLDEKEIASLATGTFTFSIVPHEAGEHQIYAMATAGNVIVRGETSTINIEEEVANSEVTVGKASSSLSNTYEVLRPYYKNSQSETVYTAEKLAAAGLKAGDKISSMSFRGTTTGSLDMTMQFYISNTDNTNVTDKVNGSIDDMTKVYDGAYTMPATESTSSALDYAEDVFVVEFAEPFVYTGGNLRIAAKHSADSYKTFNAEMDNTDKTGSVSYLKYKDGVADCATAEMKKQTNIPVVHFGLDVEPVSIEGVVTDSVTKAPLANVYVEVVNAENDVVYSGYTDADGKYSIDIIQSALTYNVTYYCSNHTTKTVADVNFENGSVEQNVVLVDTVTTGISEVATRNDKNNVRYNLAGQRVDATAKGIVIMNGKKYLNK